MDGLLKYKVLNFFVYLQSYVLQMFRPIFLQDLFEMNNAELGYFSALLNLSAILLGPALSFYTDKYNCPRRTIVLLQVLSCVTFQLFFVNVVRDCKVALGVNAVLFNLFNSSISPLFDKTILSMLIEKHPEGSKTYGRQRMFSTLAFVVGGFTIENSIKTADSLILDFKPLRFYHLFTTSLAVPLSLSLLEKSKRPKSSKSTYCFSKIFTLNFQVFLLVSLLDGIVKGSLALFLVQYWKDVLEINKYRKAAGTKTNLIYNSPIASISLLGVFVELLLLYNSKSLLRRSGLLFFLISSQGISILRLLSYLLGVEGLFLIMLVEMFKGAYFGLFHSSSTQICIFLSHEELRSTSVMIFNSVNIGLGTLLSGLIFGNILTGEDVPTKRRQYKTMFFVDILILSASLLILIYRFGEFKRRLP